MKRAAPALVLAAAIAGCGGSDETTTQSPKPAAQEQSIGQATAAFERALESSDCEDRDVLIHSSRRAEGLVNTQKPPSEAECKGQEPFVQMFADYRTGATKEFGTGAVVDGELKGQPTSSIFVRDTDGDWVHFSTFEPPHDHEVGTEAEDQGRFDQRAKEYVAALAKGDCKAVFRMTNPGSPQLGDGSVNEEQTCKQLRAARKIPIGLPARLAKAGAVEPKPLGATKNIAFYAIELPDGGRWTLVLANTPPRVPAELRRQHPDPGVMDYLKVAD